MSIINFNFLTKQHYFHIYYSEGLAAHFFPSEQNPLRFLVKFTIEIFMKITASTNGVEWKASSNAFCV